MTVEGSPGRGPALGSTQARELFPRCRAIYEEAREGMRAKQHLTVIEQNPPIRRGARGIGTRLRPPRGEGGRVRTAQAPGDRRTGSCTSDQTGKRRMNGRSAEPKRAWHLSSRKDGSVSRRARSIRRARQLAALQPVGPKTTSARDTARTPERQGMRSWDRRVARRVRIAGGGWGAAAYRASHCR